MSILKAAGWTVVSFIAAPAFAQTAGAPAARADEAGGSPRLAQAIDEDTRRDPPVVAYAYAAHGTEAKTFGIQAYGLGLVARGQDGVIAGGGAIWGSPTQGLTFVVDGQRSVAREFSPSAAVIVRLYGGGLDGFSLGALGKFKVDGFAGGPSKDEVESEVELGALVSYRDVNWYLDANGIAGQGTGDDGETDTEGRLRFGRYIGQHVRLGFDGQARVRVAGPRTLPNGRVWDFAAGPQSTLVWNRFYGSLTAGPATAGLLSRNVGWSAMMSLGAATF
jgi:hypothetical protein